VWTSSTISTSSTFSSTSSTVALNVTEVPVTTHRENGESDKSSDSNELAQSGSNDEAEGVEPVLTRGVPFAAIRVEAGFTKTAEILVNAMREAARAVTGWLNHTAVKGASGNAARSDANGAGRNQATNEVAEVSPVTGETRGRTLLRRLSLAFARSRPL
jgi:hypothetical protein